MFLRATQGQKHSFCLAVPPPVHHGAHLILPPPEVDPYSFVSMSHHSLSFCLNYWKLLSLSVGPPLICPMRDLPWFAQWRRVFVCVFVCVSDCVYTVQVDVAWFYRNCLTDTCNCDRGGDCECLCTSIAAYAHKCCQQGVTIHWRSPSVCRELAHRCSRHSLRLCGKTPPFICRWCFSDHAFLYCHLKFKDVFWPQATISSYPT